MLELSMSRKKIEHFFYIQHIDWNWLPQRPQFLASKLEKLFENLVFHTFYIRATRKSRLVTNSIKMEQSPASLGGTPFWNFPILRSISKWQIRRKMTKFDLSDSIVYITHPRVFAGIENRDIGFLIYDCMDDAVGMTAICKNYVSSLESKLINKSDLIICSSIKLQENVKGKFGKDAQVVSNAVNEHALQMNENSLGRSHRVPKRAIFFGVMGNWIDQDLLVEISKQEGWELEIYGILSTRLRRELEENYKGLVSQDQLYQIARQADLGLLPYLDSEFTRTIDPVKMYEYVALGLPVLATPLQSLTDFRDLFVPINRLESIETLLRNTQEIYPKNEELRRSIVATSSWTSRAKQIEEMINDGITKRHRSTPTISVVITTTGSVTLQAALSSVLHQSLPVNEIIVVIDGDAKVGIPNDSRVKVITLGKWMGANVARNKGIETSTSEVVCLLDDDDSWEPDKVKKQIERVMSENPPEEWLSWHKVMPIDLSTKRRIKLCPIPRKDFDPREDLFTYILKRDKWIAGTGLVQTSTLMFSRSYALKNPFDQDVKFHQDLLWFLKGSRKDVKRIYLNETLTRFGINKSGTSSLIKPDESATLFRDTFRDMDPKYWRMYYLEVYLRLASREFDFERMRFGFASSFNKGLPPFKSLLIALSRYCITFLKSAIR